MRSADATGNSLSKTEYYSLSLRVHPGFSVADNGGDNAVAEADLSLEFLDGSSSQLLRCPVTQWHFLGFDCSALKGLLCKSGSSRAIFTRNGNSNSVSLNFSLINVFSSLF